MVFDLAFTGNIGHRNHGQARKHLCLAFDFIFRNRVALSLPIRLLRFDIDHNLLLCNGQKTSQIYVKLLLTGHSRYNVVHLGGKSFILRSRNLTIGSLCCAVAHAAIPSVFMLGKHNIVGMPQKIFEVIALLSENG